MNGEINPDHYRIAIFGSARPDENDPNFKQVYELAKLIAEEDIDIVTGGGPGLMDAASRGHYIGRENKDLHTIGLTINLPKEQKDSVHLDIKENFERFSERLDSFMELSNVVLVAPGGVGTLLELFYTWQLVQVKHVCETPIILLGERWEGLLAWIKKELMEKEFISDTDDDFVFLAKDNDEAMSLIKKFHEQFKKGEHVCSNYKVYKKP